MVVLCPRAGVVATAPRRRECTGGSHSAPCGPAGSLRSGNPTPAARANLLRPPRMCNGRDALPRVRCPCAVFGRAGARPSRCRAQHVATYPPNEESRASCRKRGAPSPSRLPAALPQMNQCLNAIVNRKFPTTNYPPPSTSLHFYTAKAISHDGEGAVATALSTTQLPTTN